MHSPGSYLKWEELCTSFLSQRLCWACWMFQALWLQDVSVEAEQFRERVGGQRAVNSWAGKCWLSWSKILENDLQIFLISLSRRNSVSHCELEWKEIFRVLAWANQPPSGFLVLLKKQKSTPFSECSALLNILVGAHGDPQLIGDQDPESREHCCAFLGAREKPRLGWDERFADQVLAEASVLSAGSQIATQRLIIN